MQHLLRMRGSFMSNLNIRTTVKQSTALLPLMYQSMEVLVMDNPSLSNYLCEIALENPTFELGFPDPSPNSGISALHSDYHDIADYVGAQDENMHGLIPFVKDQLERLSLPNAVAALSLYLADQLDENGYLDNFSRDEILSLGVNQGDLDSAVEEIQALDPAGVGARDLAECLALQLKRLPGNNEVAIGIVREHIDLLARKRYEKLAKLFNTSLSDIQNCAQRIAELDPKPGRIYCADKTTCFTEPDLFVELDGEHLIIQINDTVFPKLEVSSVYADMLIQISDGETREYLRKKISETRRIINCIDHRKRTILSCGEAIISLQHEFFRNNEKQLKCVSLADIADVTGLSISTVSRAVSGKYLQCAHGVFSMSFFVQHSAGKANKGASAHSAKQLLARIIEEEHDGDKLSDRRLAEIMSDRGISISRRTVAKYRESLGFRNSADR